MVRFLTLNAYFHLDMRGKNFGHVPIEIARYHGAQQVLQKMVTSLRIIGVHVKKNVPEKVNRSPIRNINCLASIK